MTQRLQGSTLSQHHKAAAAEADSELTRWFERFPQGRDSRLLENFPILFLFASTEFLDHREPHHLFRLILSLHVIEQKLGRCLTQSPESRHIEFKIFPATLFYPFSSKKVLGCTVGAYLPDPNDRFDEQSLFAAIQKIIGPVHFISESIYRHPVKNKNFHLLYLELEKRDAPFTLYHRKSLQANLKQQLLHTIPKLFPAVFMRRNQEEVFKNILLLSQQINSAHDLPQVMISLEEQTSEEIIFLITLVTVEKPLFFDPNLIIERQQVVRNLPSGESLRAYLLRLSLPREPSLFRSNGSLNFYSAREKASKKLQSFLGDFRDCNGGLLIKQSEHLQNLREAFPSVDAELIETFFYSLSPLEKQATIPTPALSQFFAFFLEGTQLPPSETYQIRSSESHELFFASIQSIFSMNKDMLSLPSHPSLIDKEVISSCTTVGGMTYVSYMILRPQPHDCTNLLDLIRETAQSWHHQLASQKIVRVALEDKISSLDPRIGGDNASPPILKMLFEGLMRLDREGKIQPAIARDVSISNDAKKYTFHLRPSVWNDKTSLTAHDFEYSWKTLLSPHSQTAFDYFFHPILFAKEVKNGVLSLDQLGVRALDDLTLEVKLVFPTPYFLQLTAHPLYSPIHRQIDQRSPEWPSQSGKAYPCNGPYELKLNHPNTGYQLIKNPLYWDSENTQIDKFVLTHVPSSQMTKLFQKGEIDLISTPLTSYHTFHSIEKDANSVLMSQNIVCWCAINTQQPFFSSLSTRLALMRAIDKSALANSLPFQAIPAHSPIEFSHSSIKEEVKTQFQQMSNLSLPHQLELIYDSQSEKVVYSLQKMWRDSLGIECDLKPLSWATFFHHVTEGKFQLAVISWTSWIDDPIYTLNAFRHAHDKINFSNWEDPSFQALLDLADQEINPHMRNQYLAKAELILAQEIPVIPLYYYNSQSFMRNGIKIEYHPSHGFFNFMRTIQTKRGAYEFRNQK